MNRSANPIARFFGVVIKGQTYLNLLYLLIAFPLGLAYFIFFVVGIAVGLPLMLILFGFLILAFVALGWWVFASFERLLAIWLLRIDVPLMSKPGPKPEGIWDNFLSLLTNPVTWKSLFYLIVKLPLGIFALIALLTTGGISLGLLTAPLTFWFTPFTIEMIGNTSWSIDTLFEAAIACVIGFFLTFASLHILNYLAYVYGVFARVMLGNKRPALSEYTSDGLLADAEHVAVPYEPAPTAELKAKPESEPPPSIESSEVSALEETPPAGDSYGEGEGPNKEQ